MRCKNWLNRIAVLTCLGFCGFLQIAFANIFEVIPDSKLWWNTDPNTPLTIDRASLDSITNIAVAGSSVCTSVFLPEENPVFYIEVKVQKNGNELLWAYWAPSTTPEPASNYMGPVPAGTNTFQTLTAELANSLSLPVLPGDTISVASWFKISEDRIIETWWDDCFIKSDTGPVIHTNVNSPLQVWQGSTYVDPATCTDDVDPTCSVVISGDTVDTSAAPGTTFTLYYDAMDSDGNAATQVTQIIEIMDETALYPLSWANESELWWHTDPSIASALNQHVLENYEYEVVSGDAICTHVEFPYDSDPITGIEVRLRVDDGTSTQWVSAHWGANPPLVTPLTSGSQYQSVVPPADNGFHKLVVELNGGFNDLSGNPVVIDADDKISGTAWAAYRAAELVEVWWDTCTVAEEDIGPEFTFPNGNPYRITSTDNINPSSLYQCRDNVDGSCSSVGILFNGLEATGGNPEGVYDVSYIATDSDGNTTNATLKVVVDDTPPTLTLLEDNPYYVTLGDTYADPTPAVTCDDDGIDCIDRVVSDAGVVVDTSVPGLYTVTYTYPWTQNTPVSVTRDVIVRHEQRYEAEHAGLYHHGGIINATTQTQSSPTISNARNVLYSSGGQGSVWWTIDMPAEAPAPDSTYEIIVGYSVNNSSHDGAIDVIVNEGTADEQRFSGLTLPSNGGLNAAIKTARINVPMVFDLKAGSNTIKLLDQTTIVGVRIDYIDVMFDNLHDNQDGTYTSVNEWQDVHPADIILFGGSHVLFNSGDPYSELGYICLDDVDGICTDDVDAVAWVDYPSDPGSPDFNAVGVYDLVYTYTDSDNNTAVAVREVRVIEAPTGVTYGGLTYESFEISGTNKQVSNTINNVKIYPLYSGGTEDDEIAPTATIELTRFESSSNGMGVSSKHGERLHGYLTPRVSGVHEFYVSGNKDVELYINYDENQNGSPVALREPVEELTKVAEMVQGNGLNGDGNELFHYYSPNDYDWFRDGQAPLKQVNLVAGKVYYILALSKSRDNRTPFDKVQIAWKEPAGGEQSATPVAGSGANVIPGGVLAPWAPIDLTHSAALAPDVPPTIDLVASNPLQHETGTPYSDEAVCTDLEDATCTVVVSDWGTPAMDPNNPTTGQYTISLSATDSANNTTTVTRTIDVLVGALPVYTGGLTYEVFNLYNYYYERVSKTIEIAQIHPFFGSVDDEKTPTATTVLTRFESSSNGMGVGELHGERLHGYIVPNVDGIHTFYVSGNKDVELYINYDENGNGSPTTARAPAQELTKVAAMVQGNDSNDAHRFYTAIDYDWHRYGQAPLKQVELKAGQVYYIMALTKSRDNRDPFDKVQVAWKEPAGGTQTATPVTGSDANVIPGSVLAEWKLIDAEPTIDLVTANPLSRPAGVAYIDDAICTDDVDETCTVTVIDWGTPAMDPANPAPGQYTITLSTTDSANNTTTATRTIDVIDDAPPVATGGLTYEAFSIFGSLGRVSKTIEKAQIHPFFGTAAEEKTPKATAVLTSFESSSNGIDVNRDHGERLHGYIVPNVDGIHTFYVSGNKDVELYINYDENRNGSPTTARAPKEELSKVAEMIEGNHSDNVYDYYTAIDYDWHRYGQAPIKQVDLKAGQVYYIMALTKSRGGRDPYDKVQVAWKEPAGGLQTLTPVTGSDANVIPGSVLAQWEVIDAEPTIDLVTADYLNRAAGVAYTDDAICNDDVDTTCTVTVIDWGTPAMDPANPAVGQYTITLSATDSANNTTTATRTINVVADAPPVVTGGLTYESFGSSGISKTVSRTIDHAKIYPFRSTGERTPNATAVLDRFESTSDYKNVGKTHGERLHGYIVPNVDGIHEFYVSGNKDVELYINYDKNGNGSPTTARSPAAELTKVAEMIKGNDSDSINDFYTAIDYDWHRWGQAPIEQVDLKAGQVYYIMVLTRSIDGRNPSEKVQVAWKEPAGGTQTETPVTGSDANVIPGTVLAQWENIDD